MAWEGIPVVIRSVNDAKAIPMGYCAAGDLDTVVATVGAWGWHDDDTYISAVGQFTPGGFEVVVGTDESP